jgi:hypothetical protein
MTELRTKIVRRVIYNYNIVGIWYNMNVYLLSNGAMGFAGGGYLNIC